MEAVSSIPQSASGRGRRLAALFGGVLVAVGQTAAAVEGPVSPEVVRNGRFENTRDRSVSQAIPGWTTYGAAATAIAVAPAASADAENALRVARGKAFCYGIAINPGIDYVLSLRARAEGARIRVDAESLEPSALFATPSGDTFDWKTIELPLPASARQKGARTMWVSVGAEATRAGGAAWFDDVRIESAEGGRATVPNAAFEEPAIDVNNVAGWIAESGGAEVNLDDADPHEGQRSLQVTGRGRPVRIVQPLDLKPFVASGVTHVRVSAWGRCSGLGAARVRFEVYGASTPLPALLSLSGDRGWKRGEVVIDLARVADRSLALWINAPESFHGSAWFDDVKVEAVDRDATFNLLSNSGFQQAATNPRLPDYWGVWGDAVLCVEPWSLEFFGLDPDQVGPLPGTRVLRMHYPPKGEFVPVSPSDRLSFYVLHGGDLDLPDGTYTFSAYIKAASKGTVVQVRHPAQSRGVTWKTGTAWQRVVVTGTNPRMLPSINLPNPGSVVWLAAPQLEAGDTATPYQPSSTEVADDVEEKADGQPAHQDAKVVSDDRPAIPREGDAGLLEAFAEYDFYTTDKTCRVCLQWSGTSAAKVHARIIDATSGEPVGGEAVAVDIQTSGSHVCSLGISGLPEGGYAIQAVAAVDGRKVARALDVFAKRGRSRREVRSSRFTRGLVVDGQPFFPLFLPIELGKLGEWHLDRLSWAGFNCLIAAPGKMRQSDVATSGVPREAAIAIRQRLDLLHAHGLRFVWPLAWTLEDWDRTGELYGGDVRGLAETYVRIVREFRDHPAIIGWYLIDEPSPDTWEGRFGFTEGDLAVVHDAVKAADAYRPAYVNWNHSWALEPYGGLACTDAIGHDNYSISNEPFDLETLVPTVRMLNDSRAGRKPALAWISGSYDETRLRPSADAVRVHAWLHLVYGTRGLGYWSQPPLDPDVWTEMRRINRDATRLHVNVFGRPDARLLDIRVTGGRVHYSVWAAQGKTYVLAVNTGIVDAEWTCDLRPHLAAESVAIRRLFDGVDVPMEATSTLSDTIPACGRRVYEIQGTPATP